MKDVDAARRRGEERGDVSFSKSSRVLDDGGLIVPCRVTSSFSLLLSQSTTAEFGGAFTRDSAALNYHVVYVPFKSSLFHPFFLSFLSFSIPFLF